MTQLAVLLEEQWQPGGSSDAKLYFGVSEGFSCPYESDAARGSGAPSETDAVAHARSGVSVCLPGKCKRSWVETGCVGAVYAVVHSGQGHQKFLNRRPD